MSQEAVRQASETDQFACVRCLQLERGKIDCKISLQEFFFRFCVCSDLSLVASIVCCSYTAMKHYCLLPFEETETVCISSFPPRAIQKTATSILDHVAITLVAEVTGLVCKCLIRKTLVCARSIHATLICISRSVVRVSCVVHHTRINCISTIYIVITQKQLAA